MALLRAARPIRAKPMVRSRRFQDRQALPHPGTATAECLRAGCRGKADTRLVLPAQGPPRLGRRHACAEDVETDEKGAMKVALRFWSEMGLSRFVRWLAATWGGL